MLTFKDIKIIINDMQVLFNINDLKILPMNNKKTAYIAYVKSTPNRIYISKKLLSKEHVAFIYFYLFHEFGHLKIGMKYNTINQKIWSEYKAERFALKMMKKFFLMYYPTIVSMRKKILKNPIGKIKYPIHYSAFLKIKEYK